MLFEHEVGSRGIERPGPCRPTRKAGGGGGSPAGPGDGPAGGEGESPKPDGRNGDVGDAIQSRFRMMSLGAVLAVGSMIIAPETVTADLVAGWNFNDADPSAGWFASDHGDGWIDLGGLGPSSDLYAGTEVNSIFGWRAGDAMGLQGGGVESESMLLGIDLGSEGIVDTSSLQLSFAARRSETGFDRVWIEAWSKGVWKSIGSSAIGTDWNLHQASLIPIDSMGQALLRMTMEGSTSVAGTIRFDNMLVETVPVPTPAVASLLGVAGLAGFGRRRRP